MKENPECCINSVVSKYAEKSLRKLQIIIYRIQVVFSIISTGGAFICEYINMDTCENKIPDSITVVSDFHEVPLYFESNSGYLDLARWYQSYWVTSILYMAIYILLIALLKRWMQNRQGFELNRYLFLWNSGLALF